MGKQSIKIVFCALSVILFVIACAYAQSQLQSLVKRDPKIYTNYEILDRDKKYILEYVVDWSRRDVLFNVTVQTSGYVTFGVTSTAKSAGTDLVMGGVDNKTGKPFFSDLYLNENGTFLVDPIQNWKLHDFMGNDSHTFLSFSRAFQTCDEEHDHPINEYDMVRLVWGYEDIDNPPFIQKDLTIRGEYPIYLLDPNTVPLSFKQHSFNKGPPPPEILEKENLKLWTVTVKKRLTEQETLYHCNIHKGPRLGKRHHIVGYHARLDTEAALKHTHHSLLLRCAPPKNSSASQFFERYVNHPGAPCFFMEDPSNEIPTQYCTDLKFAHSLGAKLNFYPNHMGLSIGETGLDEYYLTQIHYNNPEKNTTIEYDVNLDFYYTDKLRPNEAGILALGHQVPGVPSILIPPKEEAHHIFGHCSPNCTKSMLPKEGIKVSFLQLHTHTSGRKMKIHHFRGNEELPWITRDDNYDGFFQYYRMLHQEVNILPEDQVTLECEYDNSWTNGSVVGGFSTKHEMCATYLFYYNKLNNSGLCRSDLIDQGYMMKYLGVSNITWNKETFDFVVTSPSNLAGSSLFAVADAQNWTSELRSQLQEDHLSFPQINTCTISPSIPSSNNQSRIVASNGELHEVYRIAYPVGVKAYTPEPSTVCSSSSNNMTTVAQV